MQPKTITIERTFHMPLAIVWKAWTDPESFKKWWGPKNYTCSNCTINFKVGGKYLASMEDDKGNLSWGTGIYTEIIPGKRIAYTDSFSDSIGRIINGSEVGLKGDWPEVMLVTLEFQEHEGNTLFLLRHEGLPVEMYEDCIKGWQESLDKLENAFRFTYSGE